MTKYLFTALLSSFFFLSLTAQDTKTLDVVIRNATEMQITDAKEVKLETVNTEETVQYDLMLAGSVLDNNQGVVKLMLTPTDFTFTIKDKDAKIIYDSTDEPNYLKNKEKLTRGSFILEYNTNPRAKGEPKKGKGENSLPEILKSMVKSEYHSKIDDLITESYGVDLIKRLFPVKSGTEISMSKDLGYAQVKDKSDKNHTTSSELSLKPKLIKPAEASFTKRLDESEIKMDPSTGRNTHIVSSVSGDFKVSLKNGLLRGSNETEMTSIIIKSGKNEILEETTKTAVRTITMN